MLGEFGGLGLNLPLHAYQNGLNASSYIMFETSEELNAKYLEYLAEAKRLMQDPEISLSAIIYTELTDVEHEVGHPGMACGAPCQRQALTAVLCR